MHALGLEFGSAAQLSKRPGSVWNCLWGNALKRSPGIIRKSRVSYPGPGFLSSATWPSLPKKHYNGLNQTKPIFSMIRNKSVNPTKDTKYKIVRNNSETNIIAFKWALEDQNWDCVENESDVNIAYDNFSEIFGKLYNEYCPVKRI